MIQNITGVVFIIFHIICCVLVWTGIKLPFTEGEEISHITCNLCTGMGNDLCIASAFPDIFFTRIKKREIGIEKMKVNEEIYRSIIAPKEESDRNIVPLEEVLLIDEPI